MSPSVTDVTPEDRIVLVEDTTEGGGALTVRVAAVLVIEPAALLTEIVY
jgi:hypothetical protein